LKNIAKQAYQSKIRYHKAYYSLDRGDGIEHNALFVSLSPDEIYERKLHDMTLRLDRLYDIIVELEEKIEDVKLRRKAVEQDAITLENIYTLLANFDKVYDKISDEEKNL